VDREAYAPGGEVRVYANAYDENLDPERKPHLEATVIAPSGKRWPLRLEKDAARHGYYQGEFRLSELGAYEIRLGEALAAFRASTQD